MPNKQQIGEILISIKGNAEDYKKANKKALQSLQNFVNVAKKEGKNLTKYTNQSFNLLYGRQNKLGDAARQLKTNLQPVKNALKSQGNNAEKSAGQLRNLAVQAVLAGQKQRIAKQRTEEFNKSLNSISSKLWVVTMGLRQAGRALTTAFTIPLGAISGVATKTFADWEQATKNLQASADLTSKKAENLTEKFRKLALVMPKTTKELLEISKQAAEAGVNVENLETYTVAIGKLTTISDELDPKQAAETLISISRAFGIAQENVERTASVIRKMAKESRGGMDDFTQAILRALPAITSLNVGYQDLTAMLAATIPVTGTASRAGTQLNAMFDKMSQNLPELASQMGITKEKLKEMIGEDVVVALKKYIEQLGVSSDRITKNQAIIEVFGRTGAKALRALISQYDEFQKRQEEAHNEFRRGKQLTEDYRIAAETLKNQFKLFKSAVAEVAKVIGDDLASIVKNVLNRLIKTIQNFAAVWMSLPNFVKKAIISFGGFLAILGPLVLGLNTILSIFAGLFTVWTKLKTLGVTITTLFVKLGTAAGAASTGILALAAAIGKFLLVGGVITGLLYVIYKELDYLFDIGDKLKGALGITAFQEKVNNARSKINANLGKIGKGAENMMGKFKDSVSKAGESMNKLARLSTRWGDKIMEKFLYGFRDADFDVLNDAMKIVDSYFEILKEKGEMTVGEVQKVSLSARRQIAKTIKEIKELGEVSDRTRTILRGLVGEERMKSIIKQMKAAIKVEDLQETVDDLKEQLEDRKDLLKEETKVIKRKIEEKEDLWEEQIEKEEDAIFALKKRKRELEKNYDDEEDILEDIIETKEEEKEVIEEKLESVEESNDLYIEQLEEQKEALKENVDDTKDALDKLRDLRDEEVSASEGMLDYTKMNLESAQNRLEREKILGKDMYDAEFRAAKERVETAENQVDLAYNRYLETKHSYDDEERALEEQIEQQEKRVDIANDEIEAAKKAAKQQEKVYEEQLEAAEDSLEIAKEALEERKEVYQEQKEIIQEEIDEHRYQLKKLKDNREKIINALKDEKRAIEEKHNKEIRILENRIDTAEDSLKNKKKLLKKEKNINDQRLKIEQERLQAAQDAASEISDFGGIAAGKKEDLPEDITTGTSSKKTWEQYVKEKTGDDWWVGELPKETEEETEGKKEKRGLIGTVKDALEGWRLLGKEIETQAEKLSFKDIVKDMKDTLLKGWKKTGGKIVKKIDKGMKESWPEIYDATKNILGAIKAAVKDSSTEIWKLGKRIGKWLGNAIKDTWNFIYDAGKNILGAINYAINNKLPKIWNKGKDLGEEFSRGIKNAWNNVYDAGKNIIGGFRWAIRGKLDEIRDWGRDMGENLAKGLKDSKNELRAAAKWTANVLKDYLGWQSPPKTGPMSDGDKWTPNMMNTLSKGMLENIYQLESAADKVGSAVKGKLSATNPVMNTNLVTGMQSRIAGTARTSIPKVNQDKSERTKETVINLNPGMMIASRGEIRNFARMLRKYDAFEGRR